MEYGTPTKLQDGRYFVKITQKDGSRVLKQINNTEVQESQCFKIGVDLSDFDNQIISQAEVCSEEWFGKKIDIESLKKAFDSSVSSGILEAPFAHRGSTIATKVFDSDRNEINPETLTVGTRCDIVVELCGIWFLKKSFGPVWRLVQARLKKPSTFPQKYIFSDDGDKSDDEYV